MLCCSGISQPLKKGLHLWLDGMRIFIMEGARFPLFAKLAAVMWFDALKKAIPIGRPSRKPTTEHEQVARKITCICGTGSGRRGGGEIRSGSPMYMKFCQ